jgi:hypothetical protein
MTVQVRCIVIITVFKRRICLILNSRISFTMTFNSKITLNSSPCADSQNTLILQRLQLQDLIWLFQDEQNKREEKCPLNMTMYDICV